MKRHVPHFFVALVMGVYVAVAMPLSCEATPFAPLIGAVVGYLGSLCAVRCGP